MRSVLLNKRVWNVGQIGKGVAVEEANGTENSASNGRSLKRGRLLYAFTYDVGFELERIRSQVVPTHRLWGWVEMLRMGWPAELSPRMPDWWIPKGAMGWRLWQTFWVLRREKGADAIIAVHEISAFFLLFARSLGWKGVPVVVMDLGLLHPKNCAGYRLWIWRLLLRKADRVVSLVKANGRELHKWFGVDPERTVFIPMSVDALFLGRAKASEEEGFILAVGSNDGKDFETLLEALPLGVRLVVVTDSYNARKVRSHPCFGNLVEVREAVAAVELRELYKGASVVVVPLSDTPHGSGHTVLLETMAMGKIVVVSNVRCMRDYIPCGNAVMSVPAGDAKALRVALEDGLKYPERFQDMRERAASLVRSRFEIGRFGRCIERVVTDLLAGRSSRAVGDFEMTGTEEREGKKDYASVS